MTDDPPLFQPYLDELTDFGSTELRKPELLLAKQEYFQLTGEVFEDDKQFEMRMASFLEYYLFDRKVASTGQTPAEERYAIALANADAEQVGAFRAFTETIHGLLEVRRLGAGEVRLRELFSAKDYDVTERRQLAGLEKGDILEARLIPFGGCLLFSPAYCYHPKGALKAIRREVKRRKKKEPDLRPIELTHECAKMALKVERYRQIAVEKIYDFDGKRVP